MKIGRTKTVRPRLFLRFRNDQRPQSGVVQRHHLCGSKNGYAEHDAMTASATLQPKNGTKSPRKRGRPKQAEVRPPAPPKRLELQPGRPLADNLADLPIGCDVGCKRNSKGHQASWIGCKLHLDTVDGDFPVSAILTSASVHDSQVAIPLAQLTAQRVTSLYDLMDSAYDAPQIHVFSGRLGHVPIIDHNPRGGEILLFAGASEAVQGTQRQRTGEQFVERALWRPVGAGAWCGQSDVPFDVRFGGPDGDRAVRPLVLKPAKPTAGNKRP